ncbi:MAG TPA: ATP-binding cassette domain-containing protein, partial [Cytophaga sp.]|nr:ATP-binding cassette domain-containing protein [Cytophaga sp.]
MRYHEATFDAVHNISFDLPKGSKLAIVGESGSGKTTLLKLLAGLFDPSTGDIYLNESRVLGPSHNLVAGHQHIRIVLQDYGLKKNQSLKEN